MILMTMTINHQFRQVEDQGKTDCFRLHNIILTIHSIQPLKVQTVVGVTNSDANWSANPILTYVIITWSNTFVLTYYYNTILQYWVKMTLKYASSIHSYRRLHWSVTRVKNYIYVNISELGCAMPVHTYSVVNKTPPCRAVTQNWEEILIYLEIIIIISV